MVEIVRGQHPKGRYAREARGEKTKNIVVGEGKNSAELLLTSKYYDYTNAIEYQEAIHDYYYPLQKFADEESVGQDKKLHLTMIGHDPFEDLEDYTKLRDKHWETQMKAVGKAIKEVMNNNKLKFTTKLSKTKRAKLKVNHAMTISELLLENGVYLGDTTAHKALKKLIDSLWTNGYIARK